MEGERYPPPAGEEKPRPILVGRFIKIEVAPASVPVVPADTGRDAGATTEMQPFNLTEATE
jgi:hypothetical protein